MDIMKAIIDIEEKARGVSENAQKMQQNYEHDLKKEIDARKAKTEKDIKNKLEQYKLRIDAESKEEAEALEKLYDGKLEKLSNTCKQKQSAWIDEITKNVTGV